MDPSPNLGYFHLGEAGLTTQARACLCRGGLAIAGRAVNLLQAALTIAVFGFLAAQALSAIVRSAYVPLHYLAQALGRAGLMLGVAAIPSG